MARQSRGQVMDKIRNHKQLKCSKTLASSKDDASVN